MSLFSDQAWYHPRRSALKIEESSQPWTTARCHRLLRPLVSRISSLRKELAIANQLKASTLKSTSGVAPVSSIGSCGHYEEPDAESGWLMSRKKRPRLTYSQRRGVRPSQSQQVGPGPSGQGTHDEDTTPPLGTKSGVKKAFNCTQPDGQHKTTSPGEMVASTPILRRARGKIILSPVAPIHELDLGGSTGGGLDRGHRVRASSSAQKRLEERLIGLREGSASKYTDLEAIYRSLETLLRATATTTLNGMSDASGPRSFLDMCLRKVPQYITELEACERLDAEESGTISTLDDIDTSAQIYNELESLGTNVGWRHLRVVVRADGLNAVRQGIEEGLFGNEFSQLIVDLCVQLGAASEAEDLVTALVDRQYPQPVSTESCLTEGTALQPLVMLNSFASQTQRTSFLLRQYAVLLSSGNLPTDWLATSEFEQIWSLAVQGLASTHSSYDAINFITQSIALLSCRKRVLNSNTDAIQLEQDIAKASQRRLMSALGILASMGLLGETELKETWLLELDIQRITIIGDKLRYAIRACINELEGYTRGPGLQRLDFLYLVLFLSSRRSQGQKTGNHVRESIGKLLPPVSASLSNKDTRTRNHYDSIAWLIASIASACGRGTSVLSHQCLDGLFRQLESLEIGQNLLDSLKAAAAFLIAQQTNNVRDLIYAESLHSHDESSSDAKSHRQAGSTLFTGYRWEETIGEWVTVSPGTKKRRASTLKRHTRSSAPVEAAKSSATHSNNSTSLVLGSVSDMEMGLDQAINNGEQSTSKGVRSLSNGQSMMMRKRPRRLRSTETLTTTLATEAVSKQSLTVLASGNRPDPEKENRVRLLAKKPRRSSGRIVLGARSLSRDSIGRRGGVFSDDELCI
ncbi:hypothetical protein F4825DRAFT_405700 [Nemania diffusa]|nr:hypothetical protein F4825DRAFT_405700 [Nemania diffusa]